MSRGLCLGPHRKPHRLQSVKGVIKSACLCDCGQLSVGLMTVFKRRLVGGGCGVVLVWRVRLPVGPFEVVDKLSRLLVSHLAALGQSLQSGNQLLHTALQLLLPEGHTHTHTYTHTHT